jgi:hypothetical protein
MYFFVTKSKLIMSTTFVARGTCEAYSFGDPTTNSILSNPKRITLPSRFKSPIKKVVVLDDYLTFFLLYNGQVLVCGNHEEENSYCDFRETNDMREYKQTKALPICDMYRCSQAIMFWGSDNQIYIVGSDPYEQYGELKQVQSRSKLKIMEKFSDKSLYHVTQIAPAFSFTIVVTNHREIYILGQYFWVLSTKNEPQTLDTKSDIVQVSAGYFHVSILTADGEVWVGGENTDTFKRGDTSLKNNKFYNLNKLNNMKEKYCYVLAVGDLSVFASRSRNIYLAGFDTEYYEKTTQIPNTGLRQLKINIHTNIRNIFWSNLKLVISTEDKLLIPSAFEYNEGIDEEISYNSKSVLSGEYNMYACQANKEIFYQGEQATSYWIQKHFRNKLNSYYDLEFLFIDN